MKHFFEILKLVNCPSMDNGEYFIDSTRVNAIKKLLLNSNYTLKKDNGLSFIYVNKQYTFKPTILISCHIDSIYTQYHFDYFNKSEIIGTLDNSICNAMLLEMMMKDSLPPNVIISFTGNEEDESIGAKETIDYLINQQINIWNKLELVITLDVTSEGYEEQNFTIENYFIEEDYINESILRFNSKKDFKNYLKEKLYAYEKVLFVKDSMAGPDESWEYDEFDLNCISFCLPTRPKPELKSKDIDFWMHSDEGIIIKVESIVEYQKALLSLINKINDDFA